MKNFHFFIFLILCVVGISQTNPIKIKYTETMYMDKLMANVPPQFVSMVPKTRENKRILFAQGPKSIYVVNKEDKEPEAVEAPRGGRMNFRRADKSEIFLNTDELQKITSLDLFNKEFLIEEEAEYSWKIHSGEQRDIIGQTCVKATTMIDTVEVTAWYAPKINHSVGPEGLYGLPGVILAASYGEDRVILATSIEDKFDNMPAIIPPTKGEKVTRKEFNKIRDEKIEEMRKMFNSGGPGGGRGGVFIRQ